MRRPWVLLFLVLLAPTSAAHDRTPVPSPLTYYAHGFDPEGREFGMNFTPPGANETPDPDTDLESVGDPDISYKFVAHAPIQNETRLSATQDGTFQIWIRPHQGNPAGAPGTRVTYRVEGEHGNLIADGSLMKDVPGGDDAVRFDLPFRPKVDRLHAEEIVNWLVNITNVVGGSTAYNPVAAPYGVSPQFPFFVRLITEVVPPPVPLIRAEPSSTTLLTARVGAESQLEFTVFNDADEPDNVTFTTVASSNAEASVRNAVGAPVDRASLAAISNAPFLLVLRGVTAGNATITVNLASELGAMLNFTVDAKIVTELEGTFQPTSRPRTPAPGAILLIATLAALLFVRRPRER